MRKRDGIILITALIAVAIALVVARERQKREESRRWARETVERMYGTHTGSSGTSTMSQIEQKVCLDAEQQYYIARRSGTAVDAYVQAGVVAAAYLQAKDETNYRKWKGIQASEAVRAGVPVPP